jgi:vacuolar protein sorting-associated protein 41
MLLGYVPPLADEEDGGDYPEVQLANKTTGDLISIDSLPLLGNKPRGPWSYNLVSNYSCSSRRQNYHNWNVIRSRNTRGGHRGLCPTCFMSSGQDFLAIRVRDINDRVHAALDMGNLKLAVCLAFSDRTSLRQYQLHDLMTLYLEDLLDKGRADIAAEECHVLIGKDAINWERWIYHFITRKQVAEIVKYIPTSSPRLPPQVYETVLEELLQNDSRLFLNTIKRWAPVTPPLFQNDFMLLRLETAQNPDRCILQAKAELYILARMYDKAITAYLEVEGDRIAKDRSSGDKQNPGDFDHIFDMIERENLFNSVRDKLVNMFRLSREHTEQFLLRNIDKLPVKSVVKQLRIDRRCLYWYLHFIFTNCYDTYNTQEFEDYHIMQVSLYAEFSHTGTKAMNHANGNGNRIPRLCSREGVVSGFELALVREQYIMLL